MKKQKVVQFAKKNAPLVVAGALVGSGLAGAEGEVPSFTFPVAGVVAAVSASVVAIATAGAGMKGLGIAIRAGFAWAGKLLKP